MPDTDLLKIVYKSNKVTSTGAAVFLLAKGFNILQTLMSCNLIPSTQRWNNAVMYKAKKEGEQRDKGEVEDK